MGVMATKTTRQIVDELYHQFYQELLAEPHYAIFFRNRSVDEIRQKQADSFYQLLTLDEAGIRRQGLWIGQVHVDIGLPFEDLYAAYQKIEELIPQYFDGDWITQNGIFHRLNQQRNAVAEGYLQTYMQKLAEETTVIIQHRDHIMREDEAFLVNKPLIWITQILNHIKDPSIVLPEMSSERCPLTDELVNTPHLEDAGKAQLLELHESQHLMGNNFLFFLKSKNYPLAIFLLSRFYGTTLDLSNRIGLAIQLTTIHDLQKDPLTGFYLRHDMETVIESALKSSESDHKDISIMMLDLDRFKQINDNYGHQSGDAVLRQTSSLFKKIIRESDKIFRYGGEEFLVLFEGAGHEVVLKIAERLRSVIESHPFKIKDKQEIQVTASLGITTYSGKSGEPMPPVRKFIETCDRMLYQAKENGRNRIESDQ